jgi:pyruvate dehydrogenase E2 component (dihydrolipoamide acetyltransferase)
MEQGKLLQWLKEKGAAVKTGEPIAVVETDKVTVEIEAPGDGALLEILHAADEVVKVGATVAIVGPPDAAEAARDLAAEIGTAELAKAKRRATRSTGTVISAPTPRPAGHRPLSSPLARRVAADLGVSLEGIAGTGPDGIITRIDVEDAARQRPGYVVIDGVRIAYERRGRAPPTTVLIHGFGANRRGWAPVVAGLSGTTVTIDLPGHGDSYPMPTEPDIEAMAAMIAAALAKLELGSVHLVGHSLGAAVALLVSENSAIPVRSLSLIAPAGIAAEINGGFISDFLASIDADKARQALGLLLTDASRMSAAFVTETVAQMTGQASRAALQRIANACFDNSRQRWIGRGLLEKAKVPVRVIWGRDDRVIPASQAAALPPTVDVHIFARAGHLVHIERAEAVAAILSGRETGAKP